MSNKPLGISPEFITNNLAYVLSAYSILLRQVFLANTTTRVALSYLAHIVRRYFGYALRWSTRVSGSYWPANVRPLFAGNNAVDCRGSDFVFLSKFFASDTPARVHAANFDNLPGGEFRHAVRFALLSRLSILAVAIRAIVGGRSDKKVSGIAAKRGVAMVTDKVAVWYRAMSQLVGDSMGRKHFAIIGFEFSVAFDNGGLPQPAVIWPKNLNVRPEAFSKWNLATLGMMTREIFGLTIRVLRDFEGTAATTLTQRGKMKFQLREARGMICHADYLLSGIGHAAGRFQRRCGNFIGFLLLGYSSTFGLYLQRVGGVA